MIQKRIKKHVGYREVCKWEFWKRNRMGKVINKRSSNLKYDWADICLAREIEKLIFKATRIQPLSDVLWASVNPNWGSQLNTITTNYYVEINKVYHCVDHSVLVQGNTLKLSHRCCGHSLLVT